MWKSHDSPIYIGLVTASSSDYLVWQWQNTKLLASQSGNMNKYMVAPSMISIESLQSLEIKIKLTREISKKRSKITTDSFNTNLRL